jgi:hypothetical protein
MTRCRGATVRQFPFRGNPGYRAGKARERRIRNESVKLLKGVQLVKVQSGQSRSWQAGSECCLSPGDWRVRSVHSKEAGREDSAPTSFHHRDADAVSPAEGSIRTTEMRGCWGVAGVPSPGHAFKRIPREPRRAPYLSPKRAKRFRPTRMEPGPEGSEGVPGKRTDPRRGVPAAKGDQRRQGRIGEQSYEPIVPVKVANRRAPARGGHGTHWREGGNR